MSFIRCAMWNFADRFFKLLAWFVFVLSLKAVSIALDERRIGWGALLALLIWTLALIESVLKPIYDANMRHLENPKSSEFGAWALGTLFAILACATFYGLVEYVLPELDRAFSPLVRINIQMAPDHGKP